MGQYVQVVTTTEKKEDAQKIAKAMVEARLAACAQLLGPIVSTYRWKEKIETAEEWLCLMKTSRSLYHEVEKSLTRLHPYDTPEIIALPIDAGSVDYVQWLQQELRMP